MRRAWAPAHGTGTPRPGAPEGTHSFERLVAEHLDFIRSSLARLGVAARDTEDAAQQVLMVAHRGFAQLSTTQPRAWLWAIARRVASDHRALAWHRVALDGGDSQARASMQSPVLDVLSARDLVHRALEELPRDRRKVLVLYEMEGLTLAEIAAQSATPLATIAGRLRTARREFAAAVERLDAR